MDDGWKKLEVQNYFELFRSGLIQTALPSATIWGFDVPGPKVNVIRLVRK